MGRIVIATFLVVTAVSCRCVADTLVLLHPFSDSGSEVRAGLALIASRTGSDSRWPTAGELVITGKPGQVIEVADCSAPLDGLSVVAEAKNKTFYRLHTGEARLAYHWQENPGENSNSLPVRSEQTLLVRFTKKKKTPAQSPEAGALPVQPAWPDSLPPTLQQYLSEAGGSDDPFSGDSFSGPPKPFMPVPGSGAGWTIDIQPLLLNVLSWFGQETLPEDYSNLRVTVRRPGQPVRSVTLSQSQWQGFQDAFITSSQGWSNLLQWLQHCFSAKGIFIDELLTLQALTSSDGDDDQVLPDMIRWQLEAVLEQPDYDFDLSMELETLSQNLGILQAGRGTRSASAPPLSSGQKDSSEQSSHSQQGQSGSRQSGSLGGGAGAGEDEDDDEDKPPRKKNRVEPETVQPKSFITVFSIERLLLILTRHLLCSDFPESLEALWQAVPEGIQESIIKVLTSLLEDSEENFLKKIACQKSQEFDNTHPAFKWIMRQCPRLFIKSLEEAGVAQRHRHLYLYLRANALINRKIDLTLRHRTSTEGIIHGATISHNGRLLFIHTNQCLAMMRRQSRRQWSGELQILHQGKTTRPVIQANDRLLAFQDLETALLHILDLNSGKIPQSYILEPPEEDSATVLRFGVNHLLLGSRPNVIRIWRLPDNSAAPGNGQTMIQALNDIEKGSEDIARVSPDGAELIITSEGKIRCYNLQDTPPGRDHAQVLDIEGVPVDLDISNNGSLLACISGIKLFLFVKDSSKKCWVKTEKLILENTYGALYETLTISPDGRSLVLLNEFKSAICFYCYKGGQWQRDYHDVSGDVRFIRAEFSPCSRFAVVFRWNSRSKTEEFGNILLLEYGTSANGRRLSWRVGYGEQGVEAELITALWQVTQDIENIISVQFSPDRKHLATVDYIGRLSIRSMKKFQGYDAWCFDGLAYDTFIAMQGASGSDVLFFSPDGHELFLSAPNQAQIFSVFDDGKPKAEVIRPDLRIEHYNNEQ